MSIYHRAVIDGAAELEWRPDEFGLRRALLLACIPVCAGIAAAVATLSGATPPPPLMVQLAEPEAAPAAPSAPEPALAAAEPEMLAPPEPTSAALSAPPLIPLAEIVEAESDIQLAPLPAPATERRHAPARPRPTRRPSHVPVEAATVPSTVEPTPATRAAPPPPPDTSSGIGPYRAGLHAQIERNMMADEGIRRLGISGVATIEAVIAPDGRVLSSVLARSSGNRAIDRAAQEAVQRGGYRPFGLHMPPGPITISVPITVGDG